jgi:hypothetical protein
MTRLSGKWMKMVSKILIKVWIFPIKDVVIMDKLICDFGNLSTNINWEKVIAREVAFVFSNINAEYDKYYDCIIDDYIALNKEKLQFCHKIKLIQMKLGLVWQNIMGHVDGIQNLSIGHYSGLDLMSDSDFPRGQFIMELKNSTQTDNSSSRKQNIYKLKQFVKDNPNYITIYGCINDKNKNGRDEVKDGVRFLSGNKLLQFIFGDQYETIQLILKQNISKLLETT